MEGCRTGGGRRIRAHIAILRVRISQGKGCPSQRSRLELWKKEQGPAEERQSAVNERYREIYRQSCSRVLPKMKSMYGGDEDPPATDDLAHENSNRPEIRHARDFVSGLAVN